MHGPLGLGLLRMFFVLNWPHFLYYIWLNIYSFGDWFHFGSDAPLTPIAYKSVAQPVVHEKGTYYNDGKSNIQMLEEIQEGRNKATYILYLSAVLFITLLVLPAQQISASLDYRNMFNTYGELLSRGPTQEQAELELGALYAILARNPYRGTWESSIKRSEYLEQEQGLIEIKAVFNQSKDFNNYDLRISIYDGWYLDDHHYDITINSGSIQVKQRYEPGKVLYQTIAPLICYYRDGSGFKLSSLQSLYINKLKLKIFSLANPESNQFQQLKLQALISSEYNINVIGRDIYEYQETFHDVILAVLIMGQLLAQGLGAYRMLEGVMTRNETSCRYSKTGFLIGVGVHISQAIVLSFLGFLNRKKITVFCLPILTSWLIILAIELRMLTLLFHDQFRENSLRFSGKIYGLFSLMCVLSYFANFHPLYFVLLSASAMLPQIYNNYMVGHKLKNSMKNFLLYVLPTYFAIAYVRLYEYNVFGFKPNWGLFLACLLILLAQITLIIVQVKYGVRSILPKFLHPQQLKYFLSETDSEDDTCSICLVSIKQKAIIDKIESSEHNQIREGEEIMENNIVLTPCRHKFHIECLTMSMKTKLECPNCRAILPPLDGYQ